MKSVKWNKLSSDKYGDHGYFILDAVFCAAHVFHEYDGKWYVSVEIEDGSMIDYRRGYKDLEKAKIFAKGKILNTLSKVAFDVNSVIGKVEGL